MWRVAVIAPRHSFLCIYAYFTQVNDYIDYIYLNINGESEFCEKCYNFFNLLVFRLLNILLW